MSTATCGLATYKRKIDKIKNSLKSSSKNIGPSGNERKSNITDPQSAKMSTNHGVIQGYNWWMRSIRS
jgi:hypothetical protein